MPQNSLLSYEKSLLEKNIDYIAGIDEVGRGALAGPMVIGAVILDPSVLRDLINNDIELSEDLRNYQQINDSKKITPKKRAYLSDFIIKNAVTYSIYEISNQDIDRLGISACTQLGFYEVVQKLEVKPQHILTDAFEIKKVTRDDQTNIIGGDAKSISIASASIIAKVYRDNLMSTVHEKFNELEVYEFAKHKGYGTKLHLEKISEFGLSNVHRKSFVTKITIRNGSA